MKLSLPTVTLLMVDCVNYDRAHRVFDLCLNACEFGAAKLLTSLPCINKHDVSIPPINSVQAYSDFMITKLADYFNTEHCLIIQYDGFIINPSSWSDEFLNYDYIGAPWPVPFLYQGVNPQHRVGNGGFSLRSRRLQQLLKQVSIPTHPEDVAICQIYRPALEMLGIKYAPIEVASKFSVEWGVIDGQFGQHGSGLGPNGDLLQGVVRRINIA